MNVCVFVADFVADDVQILFQNCVLSVSFFVAEFVPSWALVIPRDSPKLLECGSLSSLMDLGTLGSRCGTRGEASETLQRSGKPWDFAQGPALTILGLGRPLPLLALSQASDPPSWH